MADVLHELKIQLASMSADVRAAAVRRVLHGDEELVVAFCGLFCDGPGSQLSSLAHEALKQLGAAAVDPLVHVLKTGSPQAQRYALVGLKMLNEPSALQPLLEALESRQPAVRSEAIWALWMLRDPQAVPPLIQILTQDGNVEVATAAASTLGWLGDRRALEPLLWALEQRPWQLRQTAAYALGELGDEQALPALRCHLRDSKPQVRRSVQSALSKFHFRRR